jgi:Molybdopterin-guanine dinucleotide biosynthesis protein A
MSLPERVCVVLAGGPGSRLGGGKPFRRVKGLRLIDLALKKAAVICQHRIVVATHLSSLTDVPCELIADRWPGQGPLAAIVTAMLDYPAQTYLILPVDAPLLSLNLLRLVIEYGRDQVAAVPHSPGGLEPLMAQYSRKCLPAAQRMLEQGELRPRIFLPMVGARIIPQEEVNRADPGGLSFLNVNYPEDLARVREIAQTSGLIDTAADR